MPKEQTMLTAALRWAPGLLALFVLGPIAGAMVSMLKAPDASPDASLLVNTAPLMGIIVLLAVFAIAGICGLIASRMVGYRIATWAVGYVLAWAAYRSTDVPNLLRSLPDDAGGPWIMLAIEGVLCGGLAVALLLAMVRVSKDHISRTEPTAKWIVSQAKDKAGVAGAVAALLAGGIVAHLVNMDPMKGQAIFSAMLAGVAAGAAGAYAGSFVGETPREPMLAVGFCLLAVLGPIAGLFLYGSDGLVAANQGRLIGPSAMIGLDWAAGLFIGLPAGVALLESTVEQTTKATA